MKYLSVLYHERSLTYLTLSLLAMSLGSSLFYNGQDFFWYAASLSLLTLAMTTTLIQLYRHGVPRSQNRFSTFMLLLMLLYWLYLAITVIYNPVHYLGILIFWWLSVFPLGFLIARLQNNEVFWSALFPVVITIGVLLCIYAIYQVIQYQIPPLATFLTKNLLAAFLNLLIFPLLSFILIPVITAKPTTRLHLLAYPVVGCFIFMLPVINSRGAWLAFTLGLMVFLIGWLTSCQFKKSNWRLWITLLGLIFIPIVLAEGFKIIYPSGAGDMASRLATLYDPDSAGYSRFVIWQPAWELFLQQPFKGIGLGTYFLTIPPTLDLNDISANFYVHNDYLQLALEGGIVAVILLFAIMLYTIWRFYTAWRWQRFDKNFLTITSLFSSIVTLGVHSFFTFNLYLIPTMLLAGLLLARFDQLSTFILEERNTNIKAYINLQQYLTARYFYPLVIIIATVLCIYFSAQAISFIQLDKAQKYAKSSDMEQAHDAYQLAQKVNPSFDTPFYSDADILRLSANSLTEQVNLKKAMYKEAEYLLEHARKLNPLRPQTPYVLGKVYEQLYPEKQGEIINLYDKSLRIDPRYLPARLAKADYLISLNQPELAYQVLESGINYNYKKLNPAFLNYLSLYQKMAELRGNEELAKTLQQRLEKYEKKYIEREQLKRQTE